MTDPDDFVIPTVEEIEAMRHEYAMTKAELSRRAGLGEGRWAYISTGDIDPQLSTIRAFLDALQEADPDGFRVSPGRPPKNDEPKTYKRLSDRLGEADPGVEISTKGSEAPGGDI